MNFGGGLWPVVARGWALQHPDPTVEESTLFEIVTNRIATSCELAWIGPPHFWDA